jgi:outer membrane lipoprotein
VRRRAAALALALFAVGCARPPAALRGTYAPLGPAEARARDATGERVRWGGEIIRTTPEATETCFEILGKPLDGEARPREGDQTLGRFIACAPGFHDPAIHAAGREVTVTGTLAEPRTRPVGSYEYRFPVVRADTVHLWPERERVLYYYDPWYDPFWGYPWGYPFWGPYPYWGFHGRFVHPRRH